MDNGSDPDCEHDLIDMWQSMVKEASMLGLTLETSKSSYTISLNGRVVFDCSHLSDVDFFLRGVTLQKRRGKRG